MKEHKVFCIGFHKTGTTTLEVALRRLNYKVAGAIREQDSWIKSQVNHFGIGETPMRKWIYGKGCPKGNEEIYIDRFNRHNKEVLQYFKDRSHDLLVMELSKGDGWGKLCLFLDEPIPSISFPHANKSQYRNEKSTAN
jgi:hypothetical protein